MGKKYKIILLDNYDSFTYNLYHMIFSDLMRKHHEIQVLVIRNDKISLPQLTQLSPSHIIISPGPGTPILTADFGICNQVIRKLGVKIPILGVCLGHQGIAHAFGADIILAPEIVHGMTSLIYHPRRGIFHKVKNPFVATRYHSLIVKKETLPACFSITAETKDHLIMGIQHSHYPLHGVQFHPESIGTPLGKKIIHNFLSLDRYL